MPYDPQRSRPRPSAPEAEPAPVDALLDAPIEPPPPAAARSLRSVPDPDEGSSPVTDGDPLADDASGHASSIPSAPAASTPATGGARRRLPSVVLVVLAVVAAVGGLLWWRRGRTARRR